jgi:hypothetical protein
MSASTPQQNDYEAFLRPDSGRYGNVATLIATGGPSGDAAEIWRHFGKEAMNPWIDRDRARL